MTSRAEAAEQTARAILDAAADLFVAEEYDDVTLAAIAERAGVTLQTVLRRFGSKDELFGAVSREKAAQIRGERVPERRGDARAAVRAIVTSYERMGDLGWRLLRHETQHATIRDILVDARAMHRRWVEDCFAGVVPERGERRARCIDLLFTATDFYVWKLHRRDLGKSRAETEATMLRLVNAVTAAEGRA